MQSGYVVKTEKFEGPLDLLLTLIEKRKLHISEISLAEVTNDYLEYLKGFYRFPVSDAASFLVIASTLVLIKSRSLLPEFNLTEEESVDARDLEVRLKLYEKFRNLAQFIKNEFGKKIAWLGGINKSQKIVFAPPKLLKAEDLHISLRELLERVPQETTNPEVSVEKIVSLKEMMLNLTDTVRNRISLSFNSFVGKKTTMDKKEKVTVIVGFLAILELIKQNILSAIQQDDFGDIIIEPVKVNGVPHY